MIYKKDYPYVFARTSAKKAKLYSKEEYQEMAKMTASEIVERMQSTNYAESINKFESEKEGADLVEAAVNHSLMEEYEQIRDMCPPGLKKTVDMLSERHRVEDLRAFLRWKKGNRESSLKEVVASLSDLSSNPSIEQVLENLSLEEYDEAAKSEQAQGAITKQYFTRLEESAESDTVRALMEDLVAEQDLPNLARMLRHNADEEKINQSLIRQETYSEIGKPESTEQMLETLQQEMSIEASNIKQLERKLRARTLRKGAKMLHEKPLKAEPIIGYILAKESECENLSKMAQASETQGPGEAQETIAERLVLP
jgi:vacuolar-type H+-ATPase subunit C/Vma6